MTKLANKDFMGIKNILFKKPNQILFHCNQNDSKHIYVEELYFYHTPS